MDFNGGTIIIGSLLWDITPKRVKWRRLCLKDIATKIPVKVKIRYGRQSQTRSNTYSMIFSNHPTTSFGQGAILGFKEVIKSFRGLEKQAFALASAEGLWGGNPSLNKTWGTVGLLLNPNIDTKNKVGADIIRTKWAALYQNYNDTFDPTNYRIDNENSVIDKNGFLQLEWTEEMNVFDFLIATPVVPTKVLLTAKQVADKMIEKNNTEYFDNNTANSITTFQDNDIKHLLRRQ